MKISPNLYMRFDWFFTNKKLETAASLVKYCLDIVLEADKSISLRKTDTKELQMLSKYLN